MYSLKLTWSDKLVRVVVLDRDLDVDERKQLRTKETRCKFRNSLGPLKCLGR